MTLEAGEAVVIHPLAGNEIAKVQFAMYHGQKHNPPFEAIREETMKARDFAEAERQRREDSEEAQRRQDEREMIDRIFSTKKTPAPEQTQEKADCQPAHSSAPVDKKTEAAPDKENEKAQDWDIDF